MSIQYLLPKKNTIIFWFISTALLAYYGIAVCPYVASLDAPAVFCIMAISVFCVLFIKNYTIDQCWKKQLVQKSYLVNPSKLALYEFIIWFILSLGVGIFNMMIFDFPPASGGKLTVGFITIGLYSSISTMLKEDKARILAIANLQEEYDPEKYFLSLVNKFLIFISGTLVLLAIILILLFQNDFIFMVNYYIETNDRPTLPILKHILYVFLIIFVGIIILSYKYGKDLRLVLDLQLNSFSEVLHGNYNKHVPVLTNDEMNWA